MYTALINAHICHLKKLKTQRRTCDVSLSSPGGWAHVGELRPLGDRPHYLPAGRDPWGAASVAGQPATIRRHAVAQDAARGSDQRQPAADAGGEGTLRPVHVRQPLQEDLRQLKVAAALVQSLPGGSPSAVIMLCCFSVRTPQSRVRKIQVVSWSVALKRWFVSPFAITEPFCGGSDQCYARPIFFGLNRLWLMWQSRWFNSWFNSTLNFSWLTQLQLNSKQSKPMSHTMR